MGKKIPRKFIDEPEKVQKAIELMKNLDELLGVDDEEKRSADKKLNSKDKKEKLSVVVNGNGTTTASTVTAPSIKTPETEKKVKFSEQPEVKIIEEDDDDDTCSAEDDDDETSSTSSVDEVQVERPKLEAFRKWAGEML